MKRLGLVLFAIVLCLNCTACIHYDSTLAHYARDREEYQAVAFLPELETLGTYRDIEYLCRRDESIFPSYSMKLIVWYDEGTFAAEKARLDDAYVYLEEPQKMDFDEKLYTIPAVTFSVADFDFRVAELADTVYPKNFGMIGISSEACAVSYMWYYCPDHDYISAPNEDRTAAMQEFVRYQFQFE